ncbi:MAG: AI-2E family transporter [Rubrobacter sp.]|nr:AI-2E family transporter [Rubrobacter sp.]
MSARKLVVSTYLQYVLLAVGALLLVTFVPQISGVLVTFLMAAILAYALNPLVRRLERWRIPRVVAVLGVFAVLVVAVTAALLVLIIPAVDQVRMIANRPEAIINAGTQLVERARKVPYLGEQIPAQLDQEAQDAMLQFVQDNVPPAGTILKTALGFIGGVFGIFGTILNLFLMLIVSIYLLLDRERILRAVLGTIPGTVRDQILELFAAVEGTLVKYLRAQLFLCVVMGMIGWAIAFFFGGRYADNYALLIGVWVSVTELIPVLGAFLGAIPAVILALVDSPVQALIVAGLFLAAQQLEGNILVPRIMGGSVGVHPLWVMFAMLSATALYGLVGALFAVPVVAIISASVRYLGGTLVFERWRDAPVFSMPETTDTDSQDEAVTSDEPEGAGVGAEPEKE